MGTTGGGATIGPPLGGEKVKGGGKRKQENEEFRELQRKSLLGTISPEEAGRLDEMRASFGGKREKRQERKTERGMSSSSKGLGAQARAPFEAPSMQNLLDPRFRAGGAGDTGINTGLDQINRLLSSPGGLISSAGAGNVIGGLLSETASREGLGAQSDIDLALSRMGRGNSIAGLSLKKAQDVATGREVSAANRQGLLIGEQLARADIANTFPLLQASLGQQAGARELLLAQSEGKKNRNAAPSAPGGRFDFGGALGGIGTLLGGIAQF